MEWINISFILLIGIICAFYAYAKYKLSYWSRRGVKSLPTHPIFGNFGETLTFRKPPGLVLQELYESANSPYLGFYVFHEPKLLLCDLELSKRLFVKDFDVFCNRNFGGPDQTDAVGLVSILSANQPLWGYLRPRLTRCLTGAKLRDMVPLINERLQPMLNFMDRKPIRDDGWIKLEMRDVASRFSTDVLASLLFGVSVDSFNEKTTEFWENGQDILVGTKRGLYVIILFFLPGLIKFIKKLITGPADYFRPIFWDSMDTRERENIKRKDLIDYFLSLKNGEQSLDYPFKGDNLLAQAESIFTAGYEATTTVIAFTLYELARHPEHQERVYEEIKEKLDGKELNVDTLQETGFLDQVINEVLRLYPSLPFVDRVAERDYKLPGSDVVIEKGTAVYVSLNGLNRDPKYFENPNEFIPMREKLASDSPTASLSFGIGQRSCVGQRLSLIMTKIAVVGILRDYSLMMEKTKKTSLKNVTVFTVAPINLLLKKRI